MSVLQKNKDVVRFFSMAVDIGHHDPKLLELALNILSISLQKNTPNHELVVFSNFGITPPNKNVEIIEFPNFDGTYFQNKWLDLSFKKIFLQEILRRQTGFDYIWIDLDTIVTADVSYLNNTNNIFMAIGGNCQNENPFFSNNNEFSTPRFKYIQGDIWKISQQTFFELMNQFKEILSKGLCLRYDLQDLFNYHIYIKNPPVNIYNLNFRPETVNGLCVWSPNGDSHPCTTGLENLFIDNKKLRTNYHPEKEIHFLSFTVQTYAQLISNIKFQNLFIK